MRFSTTRQSQYGGIVHECPRPGRLVLLNGCLLAAVCVVVGARASRLGAASPQARHAAESQRERDHFDPLSAVGLPQFKGFYTQYVQTQLRTEFPLLVSYPGFVALMPRVLLPLATYLHTQFGQCGGTSFIDSTAFAACHNALRSQHRVFLVDGHRGKSSVG